MAVKVFKGKALPDGCTLCVMGQLRNEVHIAGRPVAVKVFKGEASPDGRCADEVAVTCAVDHVNLTRVVALVQQPQAMVIERVCLPN